MWSELKTVRYNSPEEIANFWCRPDEEGKVDGFLKRVTVPEFIQEIYVNGIWGFFHIETGEIHYWCSNETSLGSAIRFFGHELGHLLGIQDGTYYENEFEAEKFANAAYFAAKLAYEAVDVLSCKRLGASIKTKTKKPVILFAAIEEEQDDRIVKMSIEEGKTSGEIIREAIKLYLSRKK
ncbi:MAG: ribbon-helix-helix domain-containing protein [Candidatus Thorarchaeota archaeon]|nr:CopG family transcriptional regulator [Thermoplasmatales archaeon]